MLDEPTNRCRPRAKSDHKPTIAGQKFLDPAGTKKITQRSPLAQNDTSVAKSTRQEPIVQQLQLLSSATFFQWILAVHECSCLVKYWAATSFHSSDKNCRSGRFHHHMTNNAGWHQVGCLFCLSFPLRLRHQRRREKLFHHLTIKLQPSINRHIRPSFAPTPAFPAEPNTEYALKNAPVIG